MPDIDSLEKITRSIAMLDSILCPEWEYRYFSFNAAFNAAAGERMASMRNGSGDEYFISFAAKGAIIKGFDHECPMTGWSEESLVVWPGVLTHIPPEFAPFLNEPAFRLEDTTFCIWRKFEDLQWSCGPICFPEGDDPDGSECLLSALDGNPMTYVDFARNYFEVSLDLMAVKEVFDHRPLTADLVFRLNPTRVYADLVNDAAEIGYPAT
ncbi:MAG: hypothetical protein NTW74_15295 [Acidobacteria bacterium]|nr:hypothetical protein [Acidobacteriota bacterium]